MILEHLLSNREMEFDDGDVADCYVYLDGDAEIFEHKISHPNRFASLYVLVDLIDEDDDVPSTEPAHIERGEELTRLLSGFVGRYHFEVVSVELAYGHAWVEIDMLSFEQIEDKALFELKFLRSESRS